MGLAAALFGYRAEEPPIEATPGDWLAYGKRQYFVGASKPAMKAFTRAADTDSRNPLPLAYRSWAGRLAHKPRAVADAHHAIAVNPECAEAHASLALALVTPPLRPQDFVLATEAARLCFERPPADAYGSVLVIGVYLLFGDTLFTAPAASATGLDRTPLSQAAEHLLAGRHVAALDAFDKVADEGRGLLSALGTAATHWAMRDIRAARNYSAGLLESGAIDHAGILTAVQHIAQVAGH